MQRFWLVSLIAVASCNEFEPALGTSHQSQALSTTVVISQFRTRGPSGANDEFVELYNLSDAEVDLSGWKLSASNSSGVSGTRGSLPVGTRLPPRTYFLFVNSGSNGYSGAVAGDWTYASGITDDGGLAILMADNTVVDAIGLSAGSFYSEGTFLTPRTTSIDQSFQRKSAACGPDQDTDANSADFDYFTSSDPHDSYSCRPSCAGDPCAVIPATTCSASDSSTHYEATCVTSSCVYTPQITACSFGCNNATGLCSVDLCAGVTCDAPPDTQCFESAGTCSNGGCLYTPLAENTECNDQDLCTEGDICGADHTCHGTPKTCLAAPPTCSTPTVSRMHLDPHCQSTDGQCVDHAVDVPCRDACGTTTGRCLASVVIAGFRTRGPAGGNDEFVELYNASETAVDVSGWKVNSSNASGSTATRATLPSGTTLPPRSFYLLVNRATGGYSGAVPGDLNYGTGVADNGGFALLEGSGAVVDAVGMSTGSAYYEGVPVLPLTNNIGQAYQRQQLECGPDRDTQDNASDFDYSVDPDIRNRFACRPVCAGEQCSARVAECAADVSTTYTAACAGTQCVYATQTTNCIFGCNAASGLCDGDRCIGVVCNNPPNSCRESSGTCSRGTCSYPPAGTVTTCDDDNPCTQSDRCNGSGTCVGTALTCTPPLSTCIDLNTERVYSDGACSGGTCVYVESTSSCDRGCDSATGRCRPDPCTGIVCNTPLDTCHQQTGTCARGSCSYPPQPLDTSCNDGDACTTSDRCNSSGQCYGTPIACNDPPNACFVRAGSCVNGGCTYDVKSAGTVCDDSDPCTVGDACDGTGNCQPGQPDQSCSPPDAGSDAGPPVASEGGCGCNAAGRGALPPVLLTIFAVFTFGLRRRQSHQKAR